MICVMAYKKNQENTFVQLTERDYMLLIRDHMTLKALKIAGVEALPIYKSVMSILNDNRIEVHIKPIDKRYK